MSLSNSPAWKQFTAATLAAPCRGEQLRLISAPGLRLDLSAQAYSPALKKAEAALLAQQGFDAARARLFDGGNANWTEERAAWHTALRAPERQIEARQRVHASAFSEPFSPGAGPQFTDQSIHQEL